MTGRPHDDAGMTLAEMLVVIVMFGIVGSAIAAVVIVSLGHQVTITNRGDALDQARTALERIDQDIRSANEVMSPASGSGNTLVITECPSTSDITDTVTYTVSGTDLVKTVVVNDTPPVTTVSAQPIAHYLVNTGTTNVFTYDPTNAIVTVDLSLEPPLLNTPVSVSDGGTALRNVTPSATC